MNDIYLHIEIDDDGLITLHDQDGRKVAGVTSIYLTAGMDEATSAGINLYMHDSKGNKIINRARKK